MAPTPQAHQGSPPTSPRSSVASPVQGAAYSKTGSGPLHSSQEVNAVNARLAEELRSVVIMNDKWQKFYKQQEKFIAELQGKLDQQKMMTREAEKKYSQAAATHSLLQQKVKDQQATIDSFGALMDELDSAREKITRLEREVRDLRSREQQSLDPQTGGGGSEKEHILQLQLQLCIDDFKNEKKEKEKFQKEVVNLSKQLEDANALLEDYQEKVTIMRSINFPRLQSNNNNGPGAISRDRNTVYKKRSRMSSSAPEKCGISCRLDGLVNFPTAIEADFADPQSRGLSVELAPKIFLFVRI
ncbi:hypothetical protein HOLleu_33416 [Holothuria leucospilota]|uniref:Uncharacterized protein n=1 Tax=Holothuria leucospilota TaxID=206669 RepID=A0A9Q0YTL3_HOLLE|nr:hypothetical protein HOLleu_33416 [Holothuria leucospilota]